MTLPIAISVGTDPQRVWTNIRERTVLVRIDGRSLIFREPVPFTVRDGCVDAGLLGQYRVKGREWDAEFGL